MLTVERVMEESIKPAVTRGDPARLLCELDQWHVSQGRFAVSSALKALMKLSLRVGF